MTTAVARVLFVSFPYFLKDISALLEGRVEPVCVDVPTWRRWTLARRLAAARGAHAVHFFWARTKLLEAALLRIGGRKVVQHFIGTDVLKLLRAPARKKLEACLVARFSTTAAVSQNLVDELRTVGVRARLVPFVSSKAYSLPEEIGWNPGPPWRILTYVPARRRDFYGFSKVVELARRFPEVVFQVLAMAPQDVRDDDLPPNLDLLGWRDDVSSLLRECHGLLRVTEHDGLPNMVVEALAHGRYVVYSGTLPGCIHAPDVPELEAAVRTITEQRGPNRDGERFVQERFGRERIRGGFLELYGLRPVEAP